MSADTLKAALDELKFFLATRKLSAPEVLALLSTELGLRIAAGAATAIAPRGQVEVDFQVIAGQVRAAALAGLDAWSGLKNAAAELESKAAEQPRGEQSPQG